MTDLERERLEEWKRLVSAFLRWQRKRLGKTQKDITMETGVDTSKVSRAEGTDWSGKMLTRLAPAYGFTGIVELYAAVLKWRSTEAGKSGIAQSPSLGGEPSPVSVVVAA
jgi:transcriptional regulator with XRE-family HTH domain